MAWMTDIYGRIARQHELARIVAQVEGVEELFATDASPCHRYFATCNAIIMEWILQESQSVYWKLSLDERVRRTISSLACDRQFNIGSLVRLLFGRHKINSDMCSIKNYQGRTLLHCLESNCGYMASNGCCASRGKRQEKVPVRVWDY